MKKTVKILASLVGAILLAVMLYMVTAPPIMMTMTRHNPREWPRVYAPLKYGFWCNWTRPMFCWYFDTVWGADTEMRGE